MDSKDTKKSRRLSWVFYLASENSVKSATVQQLGAALIQEKVIIPLLIDIGPEKLPY